MANLASLAMVSSLFSYFCVLLLRVAHYYQNSSSGRNAAVRGRRGTGGSGRAVLVACLWLAAGLGVFSVSLRVSDSAERAARSRALSLHRAAAVPGRAGRAEGERAGHGRPRGGGQSPAQYTRRRDRGGDCLPARRIATPLWGHD